jgi:hypothetical protein
LEEEVRNRIEQEVTKRLETSSASKVEEKIVEEEQEEDLEVEESEANIPNNNGEISTKVSLIQKLKDSFSVEVKI